MSSRREQLRGLILLPELLGERDAVRQPVDGAQRHADTHPHAYAAPTPTPTPTPTASAPASEAASESPIATPTPAPSVTPGAPSEAPSPDPEVIDDGTLPESNENDADDLSPAPEVREDVRHGAPPAAPRSASNAPGDPQGERDLLPDTALRERLGGGPLSALGLFLVAAASIRTARRVKATC